MLALRSAARVACRSTFRSVAVRAIQRPSIISTTRVLSQTPSIKSFSTSLRWREAAGDSDAELVAKLAHERELEIASRDATKLPQELSDFLNDSDWKKVTDTPGTENIILTKQFGNETIKVECSIADMNAEEDLDELEDDDALADEPEYQDVKKGGAQGARSGNLSQMPADGADAIGAEDGAEGASPFPLNLSITIEKKGVGATNITAECADGQIEITYVYYYPRAELVDPTTSEQAKEAQNVYSGPPFQHLDQDLQQMFETYIAERGINEQLAWFLSRYVDFKEQREYVQWLESMKKFVEA